MLFAFTCQLPDIYKKLNIHVYVFYNVVSILFMNLKPASNSDILYSTGVL